MAFSVGEIVLDLIVNRNGFENQMRGIQGLAKKAGLALAAAFSVKKLADFGSKCIELGSDLAEVQNVVDVTFPKMSKQVDEFAKGAAASFGLSEIMAKQYTGTFGAMAKAFGFTEKQAYDMGTALTGLTGDVASFYNLSQDESYSKLKSVFTGETESLKDLGVVMTQTALDSYAMANGWGKTTSVMSEAEKVALRYAFVQQQLSVAQGDFARTSDGWANQVRVLKLQVDSIMATVGQGLINLLTPVIQIINAAISRIATLANAFKALTELLTGNKASPGEGIEATAAATEGLENAAEGVGNAADKAAKKMKGLMSFDRLNNIQVDKSSANSGTSSGSSVDFGSLAKGADEAQTAEQKMNPIFDRLIKRIEELGNLFQKGFKSGIGDSFKERLKDIEGHIQGIKSSLIDIFADREVAASANRCADKIAYALGQIIGARVSIGTTIAQNIVGGIDKYLARHKDFIKQKLISVFDITGDVTLLAGEACEAFAYIFEAFGNENGQQLTANIIGIFSNTILRLLELAGKFGRDILNCIVQPISANREELRIAMDGLLGVASKVAGTVLEGIDHTFEKLNRIYEQYFKPFFDSVAQGLSELLDKFLGSWNIYMQPILDSWAEKFDQLWKEHLQPMIDNLLDYVGKVIEALTVLWENVLKPLISWAVDVFAPVIADIFDHIFDKVSNVIKFMSDMLNAFVEIIEGNIDILLGIVTGDWQRVWDGFAEVVDGVTGAINTIINGIAEAVTGIVDVLFGVVESSWRRVWGRFAEVAGGETGAINAFINGIAEGITGIVSVLYGVVESSWQRVWDRFAQVVEGVAGSIKGIINGLIGTFEAMANGVVDGINTMIRAINHIKFTVPAWIPGVGGNSVGFNLGEINKVSIPRLAKGGIIKSPTLAMMGENSKKEAVVPLERNLEWRDAIADRIVEKTASNGNTGGLTVSEVRSIMMEAVNAFAQLIAGLELTAVLDTRETYRAMKKEYNIENKSRGKRLD